MYQMTLPEVRPPRCTPRNQPKLRQGESWLSYCVRYQTWWEATYGDEWRQEREKIGRAHQESLRRYFARQRVYAAKMRQRIREDRTNTLCVGQPVAFWFGGRIAPRIRIATAGYVNATQLAYLATKGLV